jgi:hypothetical protein
LRLRPGKAWGPRERGARERERERESESESEIDRYIERERESAREERERERENSKPCHFPPSFCPPLPPDPQRSISEGKIEREGEREHC